MSRDAQHRHPQPNLRITEVVNARLQRMGYNFTGALLNCADCGTRSLLHLDWDLVDGDWTLSCSRCGRRTERSYADPIRTILFWNRAQLEHAQKVTSA